MYQSYGELFSELKVCLDEFCETGYNEKRAQRIKELLKANEDTPLERVFSVFGCDEFDRCALALSLLVASSLSASRTVSKIFSLREGYITPAAISSVFFGLDDIIPFYSSLSDDSPLCRLLDGVSADQGCLMSVKGCEVNE